MKMKKISEEHYIIVDESEIIEGDYVLSKLNEILVSGKHYTRSYYRKILYSTQSLGIGWQQIVAELPLSEVKEVLGIVDVNRKAYRFRRDYQDSFDCMNECIMNDAIHRQEGYIAGYNQSLEDNKKKYTEEDMLNIIYQLLTILPVGNVTALDSVQAISKYTKRFDDYIQSLQTQTEWEVEYVDNKLKLKQ